MSLIDHFKVITVTHHNLDISDIGNFYVKIQETQSVYERLNFIKTQFQIEELLYLETCNRVCFIIYSENRIEDEILKDFFQEINLDLNSETLDHINSFVELHLGENAIKHVFEMASSMDSLIIGEREIFRQFRNAYEKCKDQGLCGDNMRILEKLTVETAKKVYSNTKIAEKPLSVVSLAIQAMLKMNSDTNQKILLVGSGETNSLVGKFLCKYDILNVSIFNRSIDNAHQLAQTLNASSFHLSELDNVEGKFDTIIICTSANQVVIDNELYIKMLKGDSSKKLIIDLAVPRNISEEVVENNNVDYIDISKLKEVSEINLQYRKKELERANPIIHDQLENFREGLQRRQLERAFSSIPTEIKAIKLKAITEVYGQRIQNMDKESAKLLLEMMDYMEKKCISVPLKAARESIL